LFRRNIVRAYSLDLRSDTVTLPTDEMYDVMRAARLGDDNLRDDPTVFELERLAAELTGHEAALFCPTGTLANLLGTRMFTKPGDGVVMPPELNMYRYGVIAWNSLQPIFVPAEDGYPSLPALERKIAYALAGDTPPTLVVIETPHNFAGGTLTTPEYLAAVRDLAHAHGLAFYLDGARIFNAAVAAGRPARDFADKADAVMFCLSKGLSAPVGSVLCGRRDLIARATTTRFLMGGAMRQAGLLAACGIYALTHLVDRLAEDHANARRLAVAASRWPTIRVSQPRIETNMVYLDVRATGIAGADFADRLKAHGILVSLVDADRLRFVAHRGITAADMDETIAQIENVLRQSGETQPS
jgi:threonine aldolase